MLKNLLKEQLKIELKELSLKYFNKKIKNKDEEEKDRIINILNKDTFNIDDINDLLIDYFSFDCSNEDLIELVNTNKKIDKYILYAIYIYLIEVGSVKEIDFIMKKLGYNYSIYDINIIDKYLSKKKNKQNELVLRLIDNIWNFEKDKTNSLFRSEMKKLNAFKDAVASEVLPYDLIINFIKVNKCKNLYFQLKNIERVMLENESNKLDMLLIYWTYNCYIDDNLVKYFEDVDVSKEEVIKFIKKLEENNFKLSDKRIDNLFKNFKKQYYIKNGLYDKYKELSNKVVIEYVDYYNNNFYFRNRDFIKYYNDKYNDDFGLFLFREDKVFLNNDILNSIFNNDSLLGNYFLFKNEVDGFRTFEKIKLLDDKYNSELESLYNYRKKFYRKYKCKINKFVNDGEVCFKYYMVKNIKRDDWGEFYELFKNIYKDNYKELEEKKGTLRNSAEAIKKDFVVEVLNNSFKDRYLIRDKYIDVSKYIGCDIYVKKDYYDKVLDELERKYRLLVAKDILYRLNNGVEYKKLKRFVKNEFEIGIIDDLFEGLSKRNNNLKKEYIELKMKLNSDQNSKVFTKVKSVK